MKQTRITKVLVTGARGFIGSNLCAVLARFGVEVHAVSRSGSFVAPRQLLGTAQRGSTETRWWRADLSDPKGAQRLLLAVRPDVVFHLAAIVSGSRDRENVLPMVRNNFLTTLNLLNAISDSGSGRLILAGSLEVPAASEPEATPCSPYAAAKWAGSGYARMFYALYDTPVVIARISMVYGPRQWDISKLVPYVVRALLRGERPKLSSGKRMVDWIYVDDVVKGLWSLAQGPGLEGLSVDIGSGRLVSIRKVVDELVSIVNPTVVPDFGAMPDRPLEQERVANIAETRRLIDWSPSIDLSAGLASTVAWYQEQYRSSFAAAS